MAMTATQVFAQGFRTEGGKLTAARTSYDATGVTGAVLLVTAGANGSEICRINAFPTATCTASNVYLMKTADSGTTNYLIASATMAAQTIATTSGMTGTAILHGDGSLISEANPIRLAAGEKLYAAQSVANTVTVSASVKDY